MSTYKYALEMKSKLSLKLEAAGVPEWIADAIVSGTSGQSTDQGQLWEMLEVSCWSNIPDSGYVVTADNVIRAFGDARKGEELNFARSKWSKKTFDLAGYIERCDSMPRRTSRS